MHNDSHTFLDITSYCKTVSLMLLYYGVHRLVMMRWYKFWNFQPYSYTEFLSSVKAFSTNNIQMFNVIYVPSVIPLLQAFCRKNIKTFCAMYASSVISLLKALSLSLSRKKIQTLYVISINSEWFFYSKISLPRIFKFSILMMYLVYSFTQIFSLICVTCSRG